MTKHTCALLNAILSLGFILSFSNLITCLGSTGPQVHFGSCFVLKSLSFPVLCCLHLYGLCIFLPKGRARFLVCFSSSF